MSDEKTLKELSPVEDLHAAYVLDDNGNEVPITQDMIEAAAEQLDSANQCET